MEVTVIKDKFIGFVEQFSKYDPSLVEAILNGYNVIYESTNKSLLESPSMSLNDIYGSIYDVDSSEMITSYVDSPNDWELQFPIKTFTANDLKQLQVSNSMDTILDVYDKYATDEQKKIVQYYINNAVERNATPIVVVGKTLADGHHRAVAAILTNSSLQGIDAYGETLNESINSWDPNVSPITPYSNPAGEPMGSYQNIMKQLPSSIGAVGSAGGDGGGASYKYSEALPGVSRDIAEETNEQWEDAPHFPKFIKKQDQTTKRMIRKANEHIPTGAETNGEQINYYTNMDHMGMYDMDNTKHGSPVPSPGP